jgi:hypothetical protein
MLVISPVARSKSSGDSRIGDEDTIIPSGDDLNAGICCAK